MAAIVRQSMSRTLAKDLLTDMLGNTNEYYIGIGKSDPFNALDTVVDPIDGAHDEREFFHSLQSIKKIEGATSVAKRVWLERCCQFRHRDTLDSVVRHERRQGSLYLFTEWN